MSSPTEPDLRLAVTAFDRVSAPAALELVRPVCASPQWMDAMVARRPFGTLDKAIETSDAVVAALGWQQVEKALSAHPRIGQRAEGDGAEVESLEASWSRQEQSAAADGADTVQDALRQGNVDYEQKFGHVFLICATGLGPDAILAELTVRLGHDRAQEQVAIRRELAKIVALRLAKVLV